VFPRIGCLSPIVGACEAGVSACGDITDTKGKTTRPQPSFSPVAGRWACSVGLTAAVLAVAGPVALGGPYKNNSLGGRSGPLASGATPAHPLLDLAPEIATMPLMNPQLFAPPHSLLLT